MAFTVALGGFMLFIFGLAVLASWLQKRNPPRSDDHLEQGRSTQNDSGFPGLDSGLH